MKDYIQYQTALKLTTEFYLCQSGYQKCGSDHFYGPSFRDFFLIHIIINGGGTFTRNNQQHSVSKGQGFLIRPFETITYSANSEDPYEYYWVGFNGSECTKFLALCGLEGEDCIFNFPLDGNLESLFKKLNEIDKTNITANIRGLGILYEIIAEMTVQDMLFPTQNTANQTMKKAIDYIEENFAFDISVSQVARHLYIDRSTLYRLFRTYYNCPPEMYIKNVKLNKSCEMLRNTNLAVWQVSNECGFSSCSIFCRNFKDFFKLTPTQYRKKHIKQ